VRGGLMAAGALAVGVAAVMAAVTVTVGVAAGARALLIASVPVAAGWTALRVVPVLRRRFANR